MTTTTKTKVQKSVPAQNEAQKVEKLQVLTIDYLQDIFKRYPTLTQLKKDKKQILEEIENSLYSILIDTYKKSVKDAIDRELKNDILHLNSFKRVLNQEFKEMQNDENYSTAINKVAASFSDPYDFVKTFYKYTTKEGQILTLKTYISECSKFAIQVFESRELNAKVVFSILSDCLKRAAKMRIIDILNLKKIDKFYYVENSVYKVFSLDTDLNKVDEVVFNKEVHKITPEKTTLQQFKNFKK